MTLDDHVRMLVGDLVLKLATTAAEIDTLRARIAELEQTARKPDPAGEVAGPFRGPEIHA